jgi:hypothetical protein
MVDRDAACSGTGQPAVTDLVLQQLFKPQARYDELEELLKDLPAFRRYLELGCSSSGHQPEPALSDNPAFQQWLATAAIISDLHKVKVDLPHEHVFGDTGEPGGGGLAGQPGPVVPSAGRPSRSSKPTTPPESQGP